MLVATSEFVRRDGKKFKVVTTIEDGICICEITSSHEDDCTIREYETDDMDVAMAQHKDMVYCIHKELSDKELAAINHRAWQRQAEAERSARDRRETYEFSLHCKKVEKQLSLQRAQNKQ